MTKTSALTAGAAPGLRVGTSSSRMRRGDRGVIFLGCAAAVHTPGAEPTNWIKDTQPGPAGIALLPAFGFTPEFDATDALTISTLLIVFDEGTTQFGLQLGPGFVYLDNIEVNGHTWTSPADNGAN